MGGDFYDAFAVPGGWMIVIGDVAGRGVEAAALTARARHTLCAIGEATGDPVAAVAHLNDLLVRLPELSLCTVCVVGLTQDGEGAEAAIVRAGHPLPVLVQGDRVREVGRWGTTIDAWPSEFEATRIALRDDDVLVLVLYTDGVLDARDDQGRFGERRLHETLEGATGAGAAVVRIERALDGFQRGAQADDTAVLALHRQRVTADAGAEPSAAERVR